MLAAKFAIIITTVNYKGKGLDGDDVEVATLSSKKLCGAEYGVKYECETTLKATGGVGDYSWVVLGLPEGMEFDLQAKRLKGVPIELGEFVVIFTVTDGEGESADRKMKLVVEDGFNIELRYNDERIAGSSDPHDHPIVFNEGGLGVVVVDGHATEYRWTVRIDDQIATPSIYSATKSIYFNLPGADLKKEQSFYLEIEVTDEYENKRSLTAGD